MTDRPSFNRLLLIDDEPGIRRMMSLDLRADGYRVSVAEDGDSGIEAFLRERPDIVLTDIKMPGLDGLEVLKRIKDLSPETEVIVITGHGDMESAIKSLQLEASDFITKPINPDALEVALRRARERLTLRKQLAAYMDELEDRVQEATARLLQAERMAAVGQTVAGLAHAVKNMLGGLRGGNYMVQEGLAQDNREIIAQGQSMLNRNVRRVADFVSDLLTLSKPRQPDLEPMDAGELVAEAVEVMGPEAANKDVALEVVEAPPGLLIAAERKLILDAVLNLLSNAVDAAAEVSGGRVRVLVREEGDEVVWEVIDNGPGLTPEAAREIFNGVYSSKGAAGTGLGLMVTAKTAQEHGGRVEFDRPGRGATFRLVLPRRREAAAQTTGEI
ncbi:MAG: response regulator [Proteobacteria bacterium]|nr:response regulator [Pseudomonadota bacterium]MBU1743030.1 response regulator [Pseudomonadota bacterium]